MDAAEEKKEPSNNNNNNNKNNNSNSIISSPAAFSQQLVPLSNNPSTTTESIALIESEMRGVHAKFDILPNTVCMTIPLRCLITVEMGQATDIGRIIAASDLDLDAPKHIYLMIYILWDRKVNGRHSFFDPYYQILPQTLHNMPIFWTDIELLELSGSYIIQQIHDRNQAIIDDYNAICTIAPQMLNIATIQEFQWARMCVCSRNFGLCINGIRTSALVPHADMLNHYRPRETKWTFDESVQAFTITSLQHISSGCEVLDSYGQKCNHRFLLNYGFAVEDNRELDGFCPNEVPIELSIFPNDPIFDDKIDFWIRGCTATQGNSNSYNALQYAAHPSTSNGNDSSNTLTTASLEHVSASTLKRIRICVTNNDNTRLLFSLLRIIAATPEEFRTFILGQSLPIPINATTVTGTVYSSPGLVKSQQLQLHHHPQDRSTSFDANTMIGRQYLMNNVYASQQQHLSSAAINNIHRSGIVASATHSSTTGTAAPLTTRYHRSCRDVRHPINLRNEREAMKILRSKIQYLLIQYPTTLQQDIDSLHVRNIHEYPKFSNRRHAKIQIQGEKMVLHHYLKWAQTAIEVLNVIEGEIREEIEQNNCTHVFLGPSNNIEVRWQERDTSMSTTPTTEPNNINESSNATTAEASEFTSHPLQFSQTDDAQRKPIGAAFGTSSFDMIIRRMEMEMNSDDHLEDSHDVHQTILRYCSDVLGHVRQEEFRHLRKKLLQQQQQKGNHNRNQATTRPTHSTSSHSNATDQNSRRGSEYV